MQILSFSFVIGFGFSIAGATLVGQHLGAKNRDQAKRAGWGAMRLSILSMTFFGILISIFAEPLARFMIDNDEVEVEIADNVKVEIVKATGIQGLLNTQEVKK